MELRFPPLLLLLIAAACAPILGAATQRIGLSIVVIELLLGVAIGPQGFALVEPQAAPLALAILGMAFLFFIAGLEIDLEAIQGRPLLLALAGWIAGLVLAAGIASALSAAGLVQTSFVVAIALVTTALGVLVPILRDAGVIDTPLGRHVMATGAVGELGPIIVMSLVISHRYAVDVQVGLTLAFIAGVLLLSWLLVRGAKVPAVLSPLRRGLQHSGQLPVRLALVIVVGLAVLAENLGLELALGALAAGMMIGLALRGGEGAHEFHSKLDAIGFGFLVPIFFIASGMKLDVRSILAGGEGLKLLGAFFVALLVVRLPLVLLLRPSLGTRNAVATGVFSATTLSLIVALTQIAVDAGIMPAAEAAPLVGAGVLAVLIFPGMGFRLASIRPVRGAGGNARDEL